MIYQSRAFENKGHAISRSHLMPVEGSTWSRVHDAAFHGPERWWKSLAAAVVVFLFGAALVAVWGAA